MFPTLFISTIKLLVINITGHTLATSEFALSMTIYSEPDDHRDVQTHVCLGLRPNTLGNLGNISRVGFQNGLGKSLGFGFISDDVVRVEEELLQLGWVNSAERSRTNVSVCGHQGWGVSERDDNEGGQGGLPCYSPMRAC